MIKIFISLLLLACLSLPAHLERTPDANTLWQLRRTRPEFWPQGRIKVTPKQPSGFTIGDDNPSPKVAHSKMRSVPVSREYPWLVFETTAFRPYKGYRCWHLGLRNLLIPGTAIGFSSATEAKPGIVAYNCFENAPDIQKSQMDLWAYFFDLEADFKYIKMVRRPENYIEASSPAFSGKKVLEPGDKLKITVHLSQSAEEVTLQLHYFDCLWAIQANGKTMLECSPEDQEQKIWSTEITIQELKMRKLTQFRKGDILIQGTVLGGGIKVPLWGLINYPYKGKTAK